MHTLHACEDETLKRFDDKLQAILRAVEHDEYILAFSAERNFRKQILPTYKGNRKDTRKPLTYKWLVDHCFASHPSTKHDWLEADDVLGILATWATLDSDVVLVSEDKDLKTIPCKLYNPNKKDLGVVTITKAEADNYHYLQLLSGDVTDGYKGCPSIGEKSATAFLDDPFKWVLAEGKWKKTKSTEFILWDCIVSLFEKQGLKAEDALTQARVARICRATDYNFDTREVILWNP